MKETQGVKIGNSRPDIKRIYGALFYRHPDFHICNHAIKRDYGIYLLRALLALPSALQALL